MIKKFREKLSVNGQSMTWFHRKYLLGKCTYTYFNQQVNDPDRLQDNVKAAIRKYLSEK